MLKDAKVVYSKESATGAEDYAMGMDAFPCSGQCHVHHAVLLQKLPNYIGQMVLVVIPFETIALINLMLANSFGHAVSISFPFPISNDTRIQTEFGTGLDLSQPRCDTLILLADRGIKKMLRGVH